MIDKVLSIFGKDVSYKKTFTGGTVLVKKSFLKEVKQKLRKFYRFVGKEESVTKPKGDFVKFDIVKRKGECLKFIALILLAILIIAFVLYYFVIIKKKNAVYT
jgi:hypothetical protein